MTYFSKSFDGIGQICIVIIGANNENIIYAHLVVLVRSKKFVTV